MDDLISRQAAIEAIDEQIEVRLSWISDSRLERQGLNVARIVVEDLPSAQPEIIRCKDCKWWDKYDDFDNGYCMAAKHGYWSEHWEIHIRRTYKGDFYCADAERRTDE